MIKHSTDLIFCPPIAEKRGKKTSEKIDTGQNGLKSRRPTFAETIDAVAFYGRQSLQASPLHLCYLP